MDYPACRVWFIDTINRCLLFAEQPDQRSVVVFRKDLLPISETFIFDQMSSYAAWCPTLIGFRYVSGIDLTGIKSSVVQNRRSIPSDIYLKFIQHGQYFGYKSRRLKSMIAVTEAALVHAHFGYDAVLVYDVAMQLNIPLIVTLHGTDVLTRRERWQSGENGHFFRLYPDKLQKMFSDHRVWFITVSDALRSSALSLGAPPERTRTLYTGVDCSKFLSAPREEVQKNVLFIGRLVEFKGCEYLIRAMSGVQRRRPDIRLKVIGDGPLRNSLEQLANQLNVKSDFFGAAPRSKIIRELDSALTLCLPSLTDSNGNYEAFGMVILEAAASGIPVITSALGGREAVIHEKTGFVVEERDTSGIENSILKLADDHEKFKQMGIWARKHVQDQFDIRKCTADIEAFYEHILAK